jgi:hypothetical protein
MKFDINIIVVFVAFASVACGNPRARYHVTVLDEKGKPVVGVGCSGSFEELNPDGVGLKARYLSADTDENGIAILEGETRNYEQWISTGAPGFHGAGIRRYWFTSLKDSKWQPWPIEVELRLKRKIDPHPMYVVSHTREKIVFPGGDFRAPLGFDLIERDWVAPAGKGKIADFIVQGSRLEPNQKDAQPAGHLTLTFSNKKDGMIVLDDPGGSNLVGPQEAPIDGYQSKIVFPNWQARRNLMNDDEARQIPVPKACIFRVRTVLNEKEEIVSARYGKLDGIMEFSMTPIGKFQIARIGMTYYLNGKDNERNLEWDEKTNLFKNLDRQLGVQRP